MNTTIEKEEKPATKREFVARVWKNEVQQGEHKGKQFYSIRIDRDVKKLVLTPESQIQMWPNKKREGKQDADLRMSIILSDDENQKEEQK